MAYYWVSWVQPTEDYRPVTYPPNASILGWWCSGEQDNGACICAAVEAESEELARNAIAIDWPEAAFQSTEWRFVEERTQDQILALDREGGRFRVGDEGWCRDRFNLLRKNKEEADA